MSSYHVETPKPVHRSFRLTRPGAPVPQQSQVRPALVLPEREVRDLLAAATRSDVSRGGVFSAGPAGIQVWSGPWDGPNGQRGTAELLGSVDWSYDTPTRHYITVYRALVTATGAGAGLTTAEVLNQVLSLSGTRLDLDALSPATTATVPPPRDPFRSINLRDRAETERRLLS